MKKVFDINATWTGGYPNLCSGEWLVTVNDTIVEVPDPYRIRNMQTEGIYSTWSFTEDWDENWDEYTDGLAYPAWMVTHIGLIHSMVNNARNAGISVSKKDYESFAVALYAAFQTNDWRNSSCGGCI